jgi:hypothetical protein
VGVWSEWGDPEAHPQPLTWRQAYEHLNDLKPDAGWTAKKVEHKVTTVRDRLSRGGVPGLTREEVGEPVGNTLNQNLIRELMESTTLVPPDLALLDDPESATTERNNPTTMDDWRRPHAEERRPTGRGLTDGRVGVGLVLARTWTSSG